MKEKKTYCLSANSKHSRSADKANGELGTHGVVQVMGSNYIVIRGDLNDPLIRHIIAEHFHVDDDLSVSDFSIYEV